MYHCNVTFCGEQAIFVTPLTFSVFSVVCPDTDNAESIVVSPVTDNVESHVVSPDTVKSPVIVSPLAFTNVD